MKQTALKEREALIKRVPPSQDGGVGDGCGVIILLLLTILVGWMVFR